MQLIQINTEHDDEDFEALSHIVHEMQVRYTTGRYSNNIIGAVTGRGFSHKRGTVFPGQV